MTACKVALVVFCVRDACTTGQMEYQKLYFENGAYYYKYYIRKHMQVLKVQKGAFKELFFFLYFQHRSGKEVATAGNCSDMKTSECTFLRQSLQ